MIASAKRAFDARAAGNLGVQIRGDVQVSLPAVVDRKDAIVEEIRAGSYDAVQGRGDLEFVEGHGRFARGRRLQVGDRTIEADRVFLNTGTRDAIPAIDGLDGVDYLTSRTILDLRDLPQHLVVGGGGYVGCEFAQVFARFGARVTVVQRGKRLLPSEDAGVSAVVEQAFRDEGIDVLTGTACTSVTNADNAVRVICQGVETAELSATHLLIAAGRVPNSDDLGLEHLGLALGEGGFVAVDENLHAGADDVWALDLRGA